MQEHDKKLIRSKIQDLINSLRILGIHIPGYSHNNYENFIAGVTPIYYSGPFFTDNEVIASVEALLIGKWMSAGENVHAFEKEFSKKIRNLFSVMVNSGSSANLIMIASLVDYFNWKKDDEIIVSAVGFPTTTSVIVQNNLKPVFVDIEMDTLNFDIDRIEEKITEKTKAIVVSPVLGNPPDFDRLMEICKKYNLQFVLDNCDSLGSKWDGQYLNQYAIASSCSFYPAHEITTFEGGMVSSNNRQIIETAKKLTSWGRDCICYGIENLLPDGICNHRFDKWIDNYDGLIDHKYVFSKMGYNLKPIDVTGAVGLEQLKKLDTILKNRNHSRDTISRIFLENIRGIRVPSMLDKAEPVWFGTPFVCDSSEIKNSLVKHLERHKIQTRHYFAGNLLMHPGYEHLGNYRDYPNANLVLDRVFFIGANPAYNQDVFNYIESVVREYE
jgi:CDP-6-deoxy-D-xylo-4-hexulose-3-dehydrase